jgi:hypothetical protein
LSQPIGLSVRRQSPIDRPAGRRGATQGRRLGGPTACSKRRFGATRAERRAWRTGARRDTQRFCSQSHNCRGVARGEFAVTCYNAPAPSHGMAFFERQGLSWFQPWCSREGGNYRLSTMRALKKPGGTHLLAIIVAYRAQSLISISRKLPVHDEYDRMRLAPKFFLIRYHISYLETHGGGCLDVACDGPNDIYKFWCIHSTSAHG